MVTRRLNVGFGQGAPRMDAGFGRIGISFTPDNLTAVQPPPQTNASSIKWNPGYYLLSGNWDGTGASNNAEINTLPTYPLFSGWVGNYSWGKMFPTQSSIVANQSTLVANWTSSGIFADFLKQQAVKPGSPFRAYWRTTQYRNVVQTSGGQSSTSAGGLIPPYILNAPGGTLNSSKGTVTLPLSPNPAQYGWWGSQYDGTSVYSVIIGANLWHGGVNQLLIDDYTFFLNTIVPSIPGLTQYDNLAVKDHPLWDGLKSNDEISYTFGGGTGGWLGAPPTTGGYAPTLANAYACIKNLQTSLKAAAPKMSIAVCGSYGITDGTGSVTTGAMQLDLLNTLYNSRNAFSNSDIRINAFSPTWGGSNLQQLFVGNTYANMNVNIFTTTLLNPPGGGQDFRGKMEFIGQVQGSDYSSGAGSAQWRTQGIVAGIINSNIYAKSNSIEFCFIDSGTNDSIQTTNPIGTYIYPAMQAAGGLAAINQNLPTVYLSAPQGFTATPVNSTTVSTTWTAQAGVTFKLYLDGTQVATSSTNSYTFSGLSVGPHSFGVAMFNGTDTGPQSTTSALGVSPNTVPQQFSTGVTVTGTGFTTASQAFVTNVPISTTYVSPTQLTCVVPHHLVLNTGTVNLTVTTASVTTPAIPITVTASASMYIVPATVVAGIGNVNISVVGTGFTAGSVVKVDGTPITTYYDTAQLLNATVLAATVSAAGTHAITVTTGGVTTAAMTLTVAASAPASVYTGIISVGSDGQFHTGALGTGSAVRLTGVCFSGLEYGSISGQSNAWYGPTLPALLPYFQKTWYPRVTRILLNSASVLNLNMDNTASVALTFTATPGSTGATLTSNWTLTSGTYPVILAGYQVWAHATFTNGSPTVTWPALGRTPTAGVVTGTAIKWAGVDHTGDPFGNYIATVDAAIVASQAAGCYVIICMHRSQPHITIGGTTKVINMQAQPDGLDIDTGKPAWQALWARYGTGASNQPGIDNRGILFEIINEPRLNETAGCYNTGDLSSPNNDPDTCLRTGCWIEYQINNSQGGSNYDTPNWWQVYGTDQFMTDIRAAGHNNVVIGGGNSLNTMTKGWTKWKPTTETLNPPQFAASVHFYADRYTNGTANAYPFTNYGPYPQILGDNNFDGNNTPVGPNGQNMQYCNGIVTAKQAFICTESGAEGGASCQNVPNMEPFQDFVITWAEANNVNFIFYQGSNPQTFQYIYNGSTTSNTRYSADGMAYADAGNTVLSPLQGAGIAAALHFTNRIGGG